MDRKKFIGTVLPLGMSVTGIPVLGKQADEEPPGKVPPYLRAGDTVAITCPAGNISKEDIQPAIDRLTAWGFRVKIGNTVGKKDYTFGGTDEERLADLQALLDDSTVSAILSARGGYGAIRIIDRLDFSRFRVSPKWIIGFSDITVLHSHINRQFNIATIHAKMCNSFPSTWDAAEETQRTSIESIRRCLSGEKMEYAKAPGVNDVYGTAAGQLVGGNLKMLESLAGSKSDIKTTNKILFLEDTGEYLYSIDRMFWNLERSGKLAGLTGLIIGGFKNKQDDPGEEFGKTLVEIVREKTKAYAYPVCFDFPVGHQKENVALKCGIKHRLVVSANGVTLQEI